MVRQNPEGAFGAAETVPKISQPIEPEDDWEEGADTAADRDEKSREEAEN